MFEPDMSFVSGNYLMMMNLEAARYNVDMLMNLRGAQFDMDVLKAHNVVRRNPKHFIPKLKEILAKNGKDAEVSECIQYLQKRPPMGTLVWNDDLAKAARDMANDAGPKHIKGHKGSNGSDASKRAAKYLGNVAVNENIAYGSYASAEMMVFQLILDRNVAG